MACCRFSSMSESCLKVGMDLLNRLSNYSSHSTQPNEAHTLSDWGKKTAAGFPPGQCVPGNDWPYLLSTSEILEESVGATDWKILFLTGFRFIQNGLTWKALWSFTQRVSHSFARLVFEDGRTRNQGFTEMMVVIGAFKGISDWRPSGSLWSDLRCYLNRVPHLCKRDKHMYARGN